MKRVDDPRSPRKKKHDLAEMLTYLILGYVTGHTTFRRALAWARRHEQWLRKMGMKLTGGIASPSTVCRALSDIDDILFLCVFVEWISDICCSKNTHLAVDGKALRAAANKTKNGTTPMVLNLIDVKTGLVLAQYPIPDKTNEITTIPTLLSYFDISESTITADALNTQTNVMEYITYNDGHFVLPIKKNQPNSYNEIVSMFEDIKDEIKKTQENPKYLTKYPDLMKVYDTISTFEKAHGRCEYRKISILNDASFISRVQDDWAFVKSVGYSEQVRILTVRDKNGNDITPNKQQFMAEGTFRQKNPRKGDEENDDIQVVGMISDKEMTAEEMGRYKRLHWTVENRLHHILDDTFREDRSPARNSWKNLSLIRKIAINILRLVSIQTNNTSPFTELMDLLNDDLDLLGRYVFKPIESLY